MHGIKALTFDTGGTILDWHKGISTILAEAGARHELERDWATIANDYRAASLKAMVNTGAGAPASPRRGTTKDPPDRVAVVSRGRKRVTGGLGVATAAWVAPTCLGGCCPA